MSYSCFAKFYDLLTEDVDYKSAAKYLTQLLSENGIPKDGILLDLACGTATLGIELAKSGFDIIGVDSSEEMLSIAHQKVFESNIKNIMLLCQDMCSLDLYGTIDAAVCMLDSLNHLENLNQIKTAFTKVSLFMNPGGIFIFDVNTEYKHREILSDNTFVYDLDSLYCVWQNQFNEEDSSVKIFLDFFEEENGKYSRSTQYIKENAYPINELKNILFDTGFEVLNIYDGMTKNPVNDKTQRAVFVARKVK